MVICCCVFLSLFDNCQWFDPFYLVSQAFQLSFKSFLIPLILWVPLANYFALSYIRHLWFLFDRFYYVFCLCTFVRLTVLLRDMSLFLSFLYCTSSFGTLSNIYLCCHLDSVLFPKVYQAFSCRTLESAFNLGRLLFFCLHSTSCNSWLESVALGGHSNLLSFSKQLDITLLRVVWNFQSTIIIQTTIGPSVLMKLAHQTEYRTIFEVWDPTNICVEIVWWKF